MDAQICHSLVKRLDISSIQQVVQDSLIQSCCACEASEEHLMIELAQTAQQIARGCRDQIGQATASIHLGMAYAHKNQFDKAISACEQAKRIFHRDPARRQRHGEGMAAYGLGLIFQHHSTWLYSNRAKAIGHLRARAIGQYQESLSLLEQAMQHYAGIGDKKHFLDLEEIRQDIRHRIAGQIPIIYVDGAKYQLVPVEHADQTFPDPQPNADYHPILIGGDIGQEFGLSPGDGVLVRYPIQDDVIEHHLETHDGTVRAGLFQRDAQGKIRFPLPGADESKAGFVTAILKPTN